MAFHSHLDLHLEARLKDGGIGNQLQQKGIAIIGVIKAGAAACLLRGNRELLQGFAKERQMAEHALVILYRHSGHEIGGIRDMEHEGCRLQPA